MVNPLHSRGRRYSFDALHEAKDSYAVTSSAAAQVDSSAKVITVDDARFDAVAMIEVSALKITANDELYHIIVQGSTTIGFDAGTVENLEMLELGATEVRKGSAKDSAIGYFELMFSNAKGDDHYPYLRAYTHVAGTSPSITHTVNFGRMFGI